METTLVRLRRMLAGILLLGMTGTGIELLLLKHDEGALQLVPLVLLGAGILAVGWDLVSTSLASAAALRVVMVLFLAAGAAGIYFHYGANVEFQHETDPSLAGRPLFWRVMRAKAPPALAPGILAQLALIGLAYTYRTRSTDR